MKDLCPRCGQPFAVPGGTVCPVCRLRVGLQTAGEVYAGFLSRRGDRPSEDFEGLCMAHADLAQELRQLHAIASASKSGISSSVACGGAGSAPLAWESREEASSTWPAGARYRVEGIVARGGMGVIYAVRDRELNRVIAMKVIGTSVGSQAPLPLDELPPAWVDRFIEEARITARLDHPGVVPVHEVSLDPHGRLYFTMKLVTGRSLGEVFQLARDNREGWNLGRAVGALLRASQAVAYAHEQGVIHRDLKPGNIMVGRLGEVFVMDWGVARAADRKDLYELRPAAAPSGGSGSAGHSQDREGNGSLLADSPVVTLDGTVLGTPAYMSPEHAEGRVEDVGPASDVYSLGAVLYELLAGHPPYVRMGERVSGRTVLEAIRKGPPEAIAPLARDKPAELTAICAKAMQRSPDARYQNAGEFADDLQAWLDRRVVRAHRTGAMAELKSWILRNRLAAFSQAAGVSLLVLGLLTVITVQNRSSARIASSKADLEMRNRDLSEALYAGAVLSAASAAQQRDYETARRILASCDPSLRHWEWHHLNCSIPESRLIIESSRSGGVRSVLNREADWLAFIEPQGTLGFRDAGSGAPNREPIPLDGSPYSLDLSPDEGLMAVGSTNGTVQVVELNTGHARWRARCHEGRVAWLDFSPDSSRLLSAGSDGVLRLNDAVTGESLLIRRCEHPLLNARFSPEGNKIVVTQTQGCASVLLAENLEELVQVGDDGADHYCAAFSPDGGRLLTGGSDGRVQMWEVPTGQPTPGFNATPENRAVYGAAWSGDGAWIAWSVHGSDIRIAEADSGQVRESVPGHVPGWIPMLQLSHEGHWLLSSGGSAASATRLWSLPLGREVTRLTGHTNRVWTAMFTRDSARVVSAGFDGVIRVSTAGDGREIQALKGHTNSVVWSLAVAPNGRELVSAGQDCTLREWDLETGAGLRTIQAQTHPGEDNDVTLSVAVSPDGRRLASAGYDGNVQLWDYATGRRLWANRTLATRLWSVAWSPDGRLLAASGDDGRLAVWRVAKGSKLWQAHVPPDAIGTVVFHPNEQQLLSAHWSGELRLWESHTGRLLWSIQAHRGLIRSAVFSPDGHRIASAGKDQMIRLWDSRLGRPVFTLPQEPGPINGLAFSPDGRRLASANDDRIVRVWQSELPSAGSSSAP